jgi:hypothetical protein
MSAIIIQTAWGKYQKMLDLTKSATNSYCHSHKINHTSYSGQFLDGYFDKPYLIRKNLTLFDLIVWLDTDCFIARDVDLREVPIKEDEIGVCHYETPVPHHNTGVVYVRPGERVNKLIGKWLAGYPCEDKWKDQRVFNDIANECVVTIPDEWNSCHINPVENPIIKSFHGDYGSFEAKYNVMKEAYGKSN